MSVELCFLIDLLSDFSLIAASARSMGRFHLRRCALAASLAATYGTLARAIPWFSGPPMQITLLIPLSMLIVRRADPHEALTCAMTLVVTATVTGTCAAYSRHVPLTIAAVPALCGMTTRLRRDCLASLPGRVEVVNRGRVAVLHACIDTGNRLTEPLSGQPVMVINARLMQAVLPEGGYRTVAFCAMGGSGTLLCFRPEHVYIDFQGRRRRAPDSWIALYPGKLPGPAQALAPAAYVLQ